MNISVLEDVVFPVYVLAKDCGEVMRFDAPLELNYLEAIDVENDEYEAWDGRGRVLRLTASNIGGVRSGDITVSATELATDLAKFKKLAKVAKKVS
jgi:hypothetical protein